MLRHSMINLSFCQQLHWEVLVGVFVRDTCPSWRLSACCILHFLQKYCSGLAVASVPVNILRMGFRRQDLVSFNDDDGSHLPLIHSFVHI